MEPMTNEILLDLFTNTPFVGFLIWQYWQMRKDVKEQQEKTEALRLEALEREERMRERFELVIKGLNEDKDQLVSQLEKRLTAVESKMELLSSQVRKLFSVLSKVK